MLPHTYLKLETILKNSPITTKEVNSFLDFFKHYKCGQWIYPGAVHRVTGITIENVYLILDAAEKVGIVESYFEIICSECNKSVGKAYKSLDDIPDEYICDNCDNTNKAIENAVLIYRMLNDEQV